MSKKILNLVIFLLILWGVFSVEWSSDLVHNGGVTTAQQLLHALTHPTLHVAIIKNISHATFVTVQYAVAGMSISLVLAFILGLLASGILFSERRFSKLFSQSIRTLLSFMRSIHELVWAWLFVAAFGLNPTSALLALAIPYGGTLGRIFANMLQDVPKAPIHALDNTGASKLQKLLYVYFPYALPNMVSYALYRFECAIRASVIMSFVGLGGLGYEIQLALNDLEYNDAFSYLYALVLLVVFIDIWSNRLRNAMQFTQEQKINVLRISLWASATAVVLSWLSIYLTEGIHIAELFSKKNLNFTMKFLKGLVGIGESMPAFLDSSKWVTAIRLSVQTLQMSIFSITIASLLATLCTIPAARTRVLVTPNTSSVKYQKRIGQSTSAVFRSLFIVTRAIPELIWAMLFVFLFKPGPLPGILALAIHNFGILGKLCSEIVENMDTRPLKNLSSSGASRLQLLFYGVIPLTIPKFITYILYRWEVIIRTTIIVGFVGAGGLGQAFKLSMSWFHYTDITLYLICYLILIGSVDLFSQYLRKHYP